MAFFKDKKKVGFVADVIRCDEPTYLVWKWHPDGTAHGEHKREYSIRTNSVLRVKEGEVAVFVYRQKDGTMQDFVEGPFEEKLKTKNMPILSSILGLGFAGDTPFQAEVYFINLSKIIQIRFAVPYFDVYDPRYPDFGVPVAVRGSLDFKIDDYKEFIKIHRLINFDLVDFERQIRDVIIKNAKSVITNIAIEKNLPVIQIERCTTDVCDAIKDKIFDRLKNDFGVIINDVDVNAIEIDKTSSDYRELVEITKDVTTATIQAQTMANLEHYAENLRIQREEGQYAMHKQTQTANFGAYQLEKQAEVGVAGAEALGKMGSNGAGGVDLSGGGGFNPAAMMASMAVGGVVGHNIAATMGNAMSGAPAVPPPVPTVVYYVAKNGQSSGPFNLEKIGQMIATGEVDKNTLVWKQGTADWQRAELFEELKMLFPPAIPK